MLEKYLPGRRAVHVLLAGLLGLWPSSAMRAQDLSELQIDRRTAQEKELGIFPQGIALPDFPKDSQWLNTGGPIRKRDLKGKFVVIDFWTYCCINCIHILPETEEAGGKVP